VCVMSLQYLPHFLLVALPFGGYPDAKVTGKKLLLMPPDMLGFIVAEFFVLSGRCAR
jgi:hypothetical protein